MCTVTYYPIQKQDFILTTNRDERPDRDMAKLPEPQMVHGYKVIYPRDPEGGGTWIVSSEKSTLCLLNGSDVNHKRNPPYRKSRGLILLDYFIYDNVGEYANQHDFHNIEPFTLIVVEHNSRKLTQLRWYGDHVNLVQLPDNKEYIWSSYQLYKPDIIAMRDDWFTLFLQTGPHNAASLFDFHRFGGSGNPENDLVMSREGKVLTVSITQIVNSQTTWMTYSDLRSKSQKKINLDV